jgi:hypothetical protein
MSLIAVSGPVSIGEAQRLGIDRTLEAWLGEGDTLVTGGAYGVDTRAALWALGEGIRVVLIVPRSLLWHRELRACSGTSLIEVDGSYMDRNEAIAEFAHQLIAFPHTKREHLRSGTWATVRRFEARMKPTVIQPLSVFK